MILTKEQAEKRVSSENNIVNQLENRITTEIKVIDKNKGNNQVGKPGVRNLTQEERVEVATLANLTGDEVASHVFGISEGHANSLKNYSVNTSSFRGENIRKTDTDLQAKVEERLEKTKFNIQEIAAEKLLKAFNCLNDDKLQNCSAKEVAQIASQVSQVVRNLSTSSQKNNGNTNNNVRIILQQPKVSREEHFETIEVKIG